MITSEVIYSKDSKKKIRTWQYEVESNKWRTIAGLDTGKKVVSAWTVCKGKSIGRSNETTPDQQALAEAVADLNKRLDRDYRRTIPELDSVPPSPMLAKTYDKEKGVIFPVLEQPKLDGIRSFMRETGATSREYQPQNNVEHILKALDPVFKEFPGIILDGELYNHDLKDDFNEIVSIVRTEKVTDADREKAARLIQFHCYDIVSDDDFEDRYMDVAHKLQFCDPCIQIVVTSWAHNQDELDASYGEHMVDGYEGQMVRSPKGEYEADKRSKYLLKRKEFFTEEFELLAVEEGKGNWAGYAKTCKVRLASGKENDSGVRGNRSFLRKKLEEKDTYIGGQVTLRHFGYTPDGKLRFPVIVDWLPNGRQD